jgi:hypothetical protein
MGMIKLSQSGSVIWSRGFNRTGEPNGYYPYTMGKFSLSLNDNSYIACGFYEGSLGHNAIMARVDSMGNLLFLKRHVLTYSEFWRTKQLKDGNLISVGLCGSPNKLFIMKSDISGNVLWAKSYPMGEWIYAAADIEENPCGNLYVTGLQTALADPLSDSKFFILKTDAAGSTIFLKRYGDAIKGDSLRQWSTDLLLGANNDIYLLGSRFDPYANPSTQNTFLMKIDTTGAVVQTNKYANLVASGNMVFAGNNELIFSGWTDKFGAGMSDNYLCKTNNNGAEGCDIEALSFTCANISCSATPLTFSVISDLSMTVVPITVESGAVITTKCQTLDIPTGINTLKTNEDFMIYPNPVSDLLTIRIINASVTETKIFDPYGKIILQDLFSDLIKEKTIDVSSLRKGVYFISLTSTSGGIFAKFIKE